MGSFLVSKPGHHFMCLLSISTYFLWIVCIISPLFYSVVHTCIALLKFFYTVFQSFIACHLWQLSLYKIYNVYIVKSIMLYLHAFWVWCITSKILFYFNIIKTFLYVFFQILFEFLVHLDFIFIYDD